MKWITRGRPKIDRIACPWLIARFIDQDAEFLYVPPNDVLGIAAETGAIPYDIPGVELSHEDDLCSFDAFLKRYALEDKALRQLAVIVRGADTSRLELTPQSAGGFMPSPWVCFYAISAVNDQCVPSFQKQRFPIVLPIADGHIQ